jgi:hypothetical protein
VAICCGDHLQCSSVVTTAQFTLPPASLRGLRAARRLSACSAIARSLV